MILFLSFLMLMSGSSFASESYSKAGVIIDAGDSLVDAIAPIAKATARPGAHALLGGFSSVFDMAQLSYKDPLILTTTDGVGTKLKLAVACNKHDTIGIDLVAMCVNDLLVHGGEPVVFLDYFATGHLDVAQATAVIKGIAVGCKQSNCALAGGETAEMPGMYNNHEYDLAGFALGIVERTQLLPRLYGIHVGHVVIGLASSGIHSNGFSLVRHLINKYDIDLFQKPPFPSEHSCLWQALLEPTIIYVQALLPFSQSRVYKSVSAYYWRWIAGKYSSHSTRPLCC
jgi:phosphoribosylaminoimidazole synthetase